MLNFLTFRLLMQKTFVSFAQKISEAFSKRQIVTRHLPSSRPQALLLNGAPLTFDGTPFNKVVTRMDTPKYGETLKFMYINYQPISVILPKVTKFNYVITRTIYES